MRLNSGVAHFLTWTLMGSILIYFQTYVLSRQPNPWLHLDFFALLVVYVSFEHLMWVALLKLLVFAFLMQSLSIAPAGVFVMYAMFCLVIATLLSRFIVLYNKGTQLLTFFLLVSLKSFLIYFVFWKKNIPFGALDMIFQVLPGILVTTVCSVPLFAVFTKIDELFNVMRVREAH